MLPDPLHPAIVHVPIALALLLPLLATCAAVAIWRNLLPRPAWGGIVLLAFVLVVGSWLALETGEGEEELVEEVVAERFIEAHEEAAEVFMVVAVVLAVATVAGLLGGPVGNLARFGSVLVSFALLASGLQVGHRGGALVYEHGAAQIHTARSSGRGGEQLGESAGLSGALAARHDHDDDSDDDD